MAQVSSSNPVALGCMPPCIVSGVGCKGLSGAGNITVCAAARGGVGSGGR